MIINHRYKFIFLKTTKTAGTSIEIALSKYCSPEDTVTPIFVEDEQTRAELGYQGPANYLIPYGQYSRLDWCQLVATRRRLKFLNHSPAAHVQQYVEPSIWNTYFKFSVERNPWDKLVSYYYWEHRGTPTMPIDEWVRRGKGNRMKGFDIYSLDGDVVADKVLRYEFLKQDLDEVTDRLGLPDRLELVRAKGGFRSDRRHYREVLGDEERRKVATVYAREIALMGYEF